MKFYRIYDLTKKEFVCSQNSETWKSVQRAANYIKRIKKQGYWRKNHELIVLEYSGPSKCFTYDITSDLITESNTIKQLYL